MRLQRLYNNGFGFSFSTLHSHAELVASKTISGEIRKTQFNNAARQHQPVIVAQTQHFDSYFK